MTNYLLRMTEFGFYCPAGDFYVDPRYPVPRAVVTHAHADHLAYNCGAYLTSQEGLRVFQQRLGFGVPIQTVAYGEQVRLGDALVSLHPAGHILGSAQVRIESGGQVWVVSGDYKVDPDPTCTPFEQLRCHGFITEATFGLPVYRWPAQAQVFQEIENWWRGNQQAGRASVILAYPLGKSQRILAGVDPSIGPLVTHGMVERVNEAYRETGVNLPKTIQATHEDKVDWSKALVVAPPSARGTPWLQRFGDQSVAFASGWMRIRGMKRRRTIERGFVLSDHVDWPGMLNVIEGTRAEWVGVTHGYVPIVTRYLQERGIQAEGFSTHYMPEEADQEES
jgi:putative mRNA 3-end processing factor